MKIILSVLLLVFMMGAKIKDGGIVDWSAFVIVVGLFLIAIANVK